MVAISRDSECCPAAMAMELPGEWGYGRFSDKEV